MALTTKPILVSWAYCCRRDSRSAKDKTTKTTKTTKKGSVYPTHHLICPCHPPLVSSRSMSVGFVPCLVDLYSRHVSWEHTLGSLWCSSALSLNQGQKNECVKKNGPTVAVVDWLLADAILNWPIGSYRLTCWGSSNAGALCLCYISPFGNIKGMCVDVCLCCLSG